MNTDTVIVREHRFPKRPPSSDTPALASLPHDAEKKIFFSDNPRRRWEQIILGGRA